LLEGLRPIGIQDVSEQAKQGLRAAAPMTDQDQQSDELKIFHDVAKALTSSLDLDTVPNHPGKNSGLLQA